MEFAETETPCLPAGRYEFKDAGIYIGEWLNEKAVGLGLITKDKCQGEFTGLWDAGSEKSGVFLWPNAPGAMYQGEWANNRRNGFGMFTREDWVIMGRFCDDFIASGSKCKENSVGRFEGEFENGFPSFGVETYADGGNYAGQYKNGIREGLGVRTSIPYGEVINFFPEEAAIAAEMALKRLTSNNCQRTMSNYTIHDTRRGSLISQRSGDATELINSHLHHHYHNHSQHHRDHSQGKLNRQQLDEIHRMMLNDEEEPFYGRKHNMGSHQAKEIRDLRMSCKYKCGFVLSSQKSELVVRRLNKLAGNSRTARRTKSLSNLFHRSTSKESVNCVRRQGSVTERSARAVSSKPLQPQQTPESVFTLDLEEAIDPETIETYSGQWEADCRQGYGICERSDGVIYEGQWMKNLRHGYGQTSFPDGTCEQGRYQNGKLTFLSWPKGNKPYLLLYNYHITREVQMSVKRARQFAKNAKNTAKEANDNLLKIEIAVNKSKKAAELALEYSLETRQLVKEMYPDFEQPGIKYLGDMVRLMKVTKRESQSFEITLKASKEALEAVNVLNDQSDLVEMDDGDGLFLDYGANWNQNSESAQKSTNYQSKGNRSNKNSNFDEYFPFQIPEINADSGQIDPYDKAIMEMKSRLRKRFQEEEEEEEEEEDDGAGGTVNPQDENKGIYLERVSSKDAGVAAAEQGQFLNVPGGGGGGTRSDEHGSTNKRTRKALSRNSSSASNYITLPTISPHEPQSQIPLVSLSKLMNNASLIDDHFEQYKIAGSQRQQRALQSIPNRSSPTATMTRTVPVPAQTNRYTTTTIITSTTTIVTTTTTNNNNATMATTMMTNNPNSRTLIPNPQHCTTNTLEDEIDSGGKISRRRTLPGILNHPPIHLNQIHKSNLNSLSENQFESSEVINSDSRLGTSDLRMSPNQTIAKPNTSSEAQKPFSNIIYYTDNGITKRAHLTENAVFSGTKSTVDHKLHPNSSHSTTSNTTTNAATNQLRNKIPIVSNVMIEDAQEFIQSLPRWVKESSLDLRTDQASRLSVPDLSTIDQGSAASVAGQTHGPGTTTRISKNNHELPQNSIHHSSSSTMSANQSGAIPTIPKPSETCLIRNKKGLTRDELEKLSNEIKHKYEEFKERKKQGEIVIHVSDMMDWLARNLLLIIFLTINSVLVYVFYILLYS